MVFQTEQSAEFLPPFGYALLTDAHQHRPIMRYHRHPHLHHRTLQPFVTHFTGTSHHQRRDVAFHHRTAVVSGTGQVHLSGVRSWLRLNALRMSRTSSGVGCGLIGSTLVGMPTVRIPRVCRAWRNSASLIPRSPPSEITRRRFGEAIRSRACCTLSRKRRDKPVRCRE
jgi:hypothetical protein